MGRCRFVQPETVRLYLVDVHRSRVRKLEEQIAAGKATKDEVAMLPALTANLAEAEVDGAFIDVKKELNAGEQRAVFAGMTKDVHAGDVRFALDPAQVGLTKLVAYIVGWSFVDAAGAPVPVSEGAINGLDTETFAELIAAIDAYEDGVEKARAMRKNVLSGATP
ncbi:MAG TPA: hypothetical protein DCP69_09980 [Candidatus Omnitrophica bacterium]|nr:hypothetical protein [Candidatus Omnitrophota bacterium]